MKENKSSVMFSLNIREGVSFYFLSIFYVQREKVLNALSGLEESTLERK